MNPLTTAQKARLGLFVTLTTALGIVTIVWLTGVRLGGGHMTLLARFTESVTGLERNAPVRYQGLRVGRVERIAVAVDAPEAIEVTLSIDPTTRLFVGTVAQLDPAGLTGLKAINLAPGDVHGPRLKDGAMLPARGSFFDRITSNATAMVTDVRHVAELMTHLISPESRGRLEHLIAGLDHLVTRVDLIMAQPGHPGESLLQHLDDLAQAATTAAVTIHGATLMAQDRLQRASPALNHVAQTVVQVDRLVQDADGTLRAGRADLLHMLGSLRDTGDNLRLMSEQLADNPAVILRGRKAVD